MLCLVGWSMCGRAQKPQWVGNVPKELNRTYKMVEVVGRGSTLQAAREDARDRLNDDTQLQEGIRVSRSSREKTDIHKVRTSEGLSERADTRVEIHTTVDGEEFNLQAIRVDEYARKKGGQVLLHTLYMVGLEEEPVWDRPRVTTRYGFAPVAMSVVPGAGQWYKGQRTKGVCLFAAEAVAVAGVLLCENNRASYIRKIRQQPQFVHTYSSRADRWETGRNVCIGVAAGIWVYNIIDAAVARGARRVVMERADGSQLSALPLLDMESQGAGVTLAWHF